MGIRAVVAPARSRAFARHYAEMVLVMLAGMAVLALPAAAITDALWPGVPSDDTTLMLGRMAVTMTLPMAPWMLWRGHGWKPCAEMTAAMALPAIAVILLLEAEVLAGAGLAMTVEHVVMFAAMFGVMLARPSEYGGRCAAGRERPQGGAAPV